VEVGDLVRHKSVTSLGLGVVLDISKVSVAVEVLWPVFTERQREMSVMLEVVSEGR